MKPAIHPSLSPLAIKILFVFVAAFFFILSSAMVYYKFKPIIGVLKNPVEIKGIVCSREFNSVYQAVIYEVRYHWGGESFMVENESNLRDHSLGDTVLLYANRENLSISVLQEDAKNWQNLIFLLLLWGFSALFGGYLIKRAFTKHE